MSHECDSCKVYREALEKIAAECALSAGDNYRSMLAKAVDTAEVALETQQEVEKKE